MNKALILNIFLLVLIIVSLIISYLNTTKITDNTTKISNISASNTALKTSITKLLPTGNSIKIGDTTITEQNLKQLLISSGNINLPPSVFRSRGAGIYHDILTNNGIDNWNLVETYVPFNSSGYISQRVLVNEFGGLNNKQNYVRFVSSPGADTWGSWL